MTFIRFYIIITLFLLLIACNRQSIRTQKDAMPEDSISFFLEDAEYFKTDFLRYRDYTYKRNIKTVQLYKSGFELSHPVIEIYGQDKLKLSFDELNADVKNYRYTIIHCNEDWTPSILDPYEYINGFTDGEIIEYQHSFNTIQKYIHYNLIFPNEDFSITKSGNYLLKVYLNDEPDHLILTRRFMVVEQKAGINADIKPASIVKYKRFKQAVTFKITLNNYLINSPFEDIKVHIAQNNRWDNVIDNLKPQFVREKELVYEYQEGNLFNAGKEFRHFDIRSIRYRTDRVKKIESKFLTHIFLYPDDIRSYKRYIYEKDINGKYTIEIREGNDSDIEADYVYVHFNLPFASPVIDGNLYVSGAFSNWDILKKNQLKYNYKTSAYEATVYVKQGYYNYEYLFVKDGEDSFDEGLVEGNSYETENDYTIFVYGRQPGKQYDELIGVKSFNNYK